MIKVKDGYAKLIGTTYQGSATQVLLSNGGNLEFSSATKANTLVQRNASQHIYATYFNSKISDEALTDIGSVYVRNTSDTFIRRISKTQFYSIIDNKFVTLDTAQTITGVKTFAASFFLNKSASLIQNQNLSSNYTTAIKWYKGGASQGTYDPQIGQHNAGGDGKGSICILPYPTETSPWGGTVGLFISKGVLKLDGKSVALAENYYTKTESDERYVNVTGDTMTGPLIVKATVTGTQLISTIATGTSPLKVTSTTVVTNLNSDLLDGRHLGNATGRIPYIVSFPAYSSFGSSTSTLDYEKNILKWIWTNQNHGGNTLLIGVGGPNSIGNLQIQLYGTSGVNSSTGYPKYSSAIYYPLGGRPICFGTTDYNFYSYSLAFSGDIKDPANYYWANIKVSASSSTATQPTFNTCYTSNWFRSQGGTGWCNQSYAGGVYMNENYWVKTYGGTMMYIAPDAHAWGIGGHNIAMKLYHSSHIGINFATSAYTWGIYANSDGNMYIGRRTGNVNNSSGTYYHTLTASYISSPGFYHSAIGSNSYVLLAGGSYKGLGDFAKGNAGSATKGVYVTGGTVTAMTYSLSSNLNSGTSGKLAYYSSATTVAAYTSSVGATNRGVYMNAGVPTVMTYYLNATVNSGTSGKLAYYSSTNALSSYTTTVGSTHQPVYMSSGVPTICGYSFKGSSRQPIVLLSGVFYRSGTTWYVDSLRTHKVVDAIPSITISGARMQITLPGTTISSGVVTQEQTTNFSASSTVGVKAHGNGAYGFAVYSNAANYVFVRTWCQRNDKNHSWTSDGESWTTFLMRIQVTLFGYIN